MAKTISKKSSAKARHPSKSTAKRKLARFELEHLRLRFLLAVSLVNPNNIWIRLKKGPFQDYLQLVDEQCEALYSKEAQDYPEFFHFTGSEVLPVDAIAW